MEVKIKKLCETAVIPSYAMPGDAGMDLVATSRVFDKYGNVEYGTGLAMEIPEGYVGLIFARSSISKQDLSLANAVGVIDSGYRGEIKFKFKPTLAYMTFGVATNSKGIDEDSDSSDSSDSFDFVGIAGGIEKDCVDASIYNVGDRIGQIIIMPYPTISFLEVDELSSTERADGGFGHTGL